MAEDVKVLAGSGEDWLKDEVFPMGDRIRQQACEMVVKGHTPGGIIMTPPEMMRFMNECSRIPSMRPLNDPNAPSGWSFESLPIARSYEIAGPAVVSREVWDVLCRQNRSRYKAATLADDTPTREFWDVLF